MPTWCSWQVLGTAPPLRCSPLKRAGSSELVEAPIPATVLDKLGSRLLAAIHADLMGPFPSMSACPPILKTRQEGGAMCTLLHVSQLLRGSATLLHTSHPLAALHAVGGPQLLLPLLQKLSTEANDTQADDPRGASASKEVAEDAEDEASCSPLEDTSALTANSATLLSDATQSPSASRPIVMLLRRTFAAALCALRCAIVSTLHSSEANLASSRDLAAIAFAPGLNALELYSQQRRPSYPRAVRDSSRYWPYNAMALRSQRTLGVH